MVGDRRRMDRKAADAGRVSGLKLLLATEAMVVTVWDME
jgi:hypothetical protein